ncbi:haloalkane dehalogenase [Sulfurifustis variabilis]|uniref:Haloalkane dehalogenase n=1 Tax=Sulfurifustis variabilis TaxID=1675686 RepID=A0A1B4UZW1_9GAMM|nr:haloalkane dehalogenase [Sulfurifustis variabilis]BAU46696.1 haloalkane dehalogenase [Sulfurifustis variabilis]
MNRSALTAHRWLRRPGMVLVLGVAAGLLAACAHGPSENHKLPRAEVPEAPAPEGRYVQVNGTRIHYVEQGKGDPILFVHGNPTSSYLWRNVMPAVSGQGRAIAIDLAGMGRSGKSTTGYRYKDHYGYLEGFIDELKLKNITFVVHDWGAALGFDYASRHPDRVKRIAFMEGVLPPIFPQPSFEAMGPEMGGMFRAFKDPVQGRQMVIANHMFVEQILPNFVNRSLGPVAMAEYRRPYVRSTDREPLLAWPREVPIAGEPRYVVERMDAIRQFMVGTNKPILLLYAEPGVLVPSSVVSWYRQNIPQLETAFVGQGLHFIQEDNPHAIGLAISEWMRRN